MFGIAVIWWWWALFTMRNLVRQWDNTREDVKEVLDEVGEIKNIVVDVLKKDK